MNSLNQQIDRRSTCKHRNSMRWLAALGFFLLTVGVVAGQKPNDKSSVLRFTNYDVSSGLPGENIHSIYQDPSGLLWLGVDYEGLVSFDGLNFEVFRHDKSKSSSLSGNFIQCITSDNENNLWIGTDNGLNRKKIGPLYYNSHGFTRFLISDSTGLVSDNILTVFNTSNSELLIGTDHGLSVLIGDDQFKTVELNVVNEPQVNSICETESGDIYIGTSQGLYLLGQDFHIRAHWILDDRGQNLSINSLALGADGNLWVGGMLLHQFDISTGTFTDVRDLMGQGHFAGRRITDIDVDAFGRIWVGTISSGLHVFVQNGEKISYIGQDQLQSGGLKGDRIRDIFHDEQGSTWVAVMNSGLNYHDSRSEFLGQIIPYEEGHMLVHDNGVLALAEGADEKLYIGSRRLGLAVYDKETGEMTRFSEKDGLVDNRVESILASEENSIFVGTTGGLSLLDRSAQTFTSKRCSPVRTMVRGNDGRIWVGRKNGLYWFEDFESELIPLSREDSINPINEDIFVLHWSRDSMLWIGSAFHGLMQYNPSSKKLTWFNKELGFSADQIKSIYEDPEANIWIGTKFEGLYKYNPETKVFLHVPDSVFQGSALGLHGDAEGNIWIRASNDVCRFSPADNNLERFGHSYGLFGVTSSLGGIDGELYFGGDNFVTHFNPKNFKKHESSNTVNIKSIWASNQGMDAGDLGTTEVVFSYGTNISFTYFLSDFSSSSENTFEFFMDGVDDNWNDHGSRNQVSYADLRPGDYIFRVKGANSDGLRSENEAVFVFQILSPWWWTSWARFGYVLLFCLAMYALYRTVTFRERKQNELDKLRLKNQQEKRLNQHKLRFFTNISHELRTPLTVLLPSAKKISGDKPQTQQELRKHGQVIMKSTNTLLKLVDELMHFRKIEEGQRPIVKEPTDVKGTCTEVFEEFDLAAAEKDLHYTFSISDDIGFAMLDKDVLVISLRNLISNAIKYTHDHGKVSMNVEVITKTSTRVNDETQLKVTISDTGVGISTEQLDHIFDRFYRADDRPSEVGGAGIGLDLVKSLVELHNGEIEVTSEKGKGSQFTFSLPYEGVADLELTPVMQRESEPVVSDEGRTQDDQVRILIVEDDPDILEMLGELFSEEYEVILAKNGAEGFEKALNFPQPNLILSDVVMPELNGLELCKMLRNSFKTSHIPILILTARSALNDQLLGLELGANDYITKPFHPEILMAKVKSILDNQKHFKEVYTKEMQLNPGDIIVQDPDKKFLDACVKCIEEHMDDQEFGVESLSKEVGFSRTQLFRKLKYLVDMSPSELIYSVRLKRAADLLTSDKMGIAEIAYATGFASPSSFTAAFKKRYKKSPREYLTTLSVK